MANLEGRGGRRRRRFVNEINVVPYIDVMLVLLVIFMVTAPLMPPGTIDLPRVGKSSARPDAYFEVEVRADGRLAVKPRNTAAGAGASERTVRREELVATLAQLRRSAGSAELPVVISADKSVRYEAVMAVMDELQRADVPRVGLMVKPR